MPELPEVETIVQGLKKRVTGRVISDVWTDWPKYFRLPRGEAAFKRQVVLKKIKEVSRRGKNILFELSDDYLMLIHQKLSGHLMTGKWVRRQDDFYRDERWSKSVWVPEPFEGPLIDPMNRFIRLLFKFSDGTMMAFSDIRRFGKVLSGRREEVLGLPDLSELGPEPLDDSFTFGVFMDSVSKRRGFIKQVLLDQCVVAGVGNIYADEILWSARLHPLTPSVKIKKEKWREVYHALRGILRKAVKMRGSSVGDYRDAEGEEGGYKKYHAVYGREGELCKRCKTEIVRQVIGARSAHYCPKCQVL